MKISVQLYTLRSVLAKEVEGTFKALRDMGLNYIEVAGTFYGRDAKVFKAFLDSYGLKPSGSHIGISELENEMDRVIEENKILENRYIVLPWIGEDRYGKGWDKFAESLKPIAERLDKAGFVFAYHNHSFEFKKQNGRPGLEIFYESGDPKLINAQIDAYWVLYGGGDPAAFIRNLKGRVPLVHLKDGKLGGDPYYVEVGQGDVNWDEVLPACRNSNVEFGAIELDECPHEPVESVRMSVEYLRGKGFSE